MAVLGTVLAVDDEPGFLDLARLHLEAAGFAVCTSASADKAALLIGRLRPVALVVDRAMPGVDGNTLVKTFRKADLDAKTVVIYWTGDDSADAHIAALKDGADDYVVKGARSETILVLRLLKRLGWETSASGVLLNRVQRVAVYRGERSRKLTEWDCAFLALAARRKDAGVTRREAAELLRGEAENYNAPLDITIHRLREKLPKDLAANLVTVVGSGWRLNPTA